VEAGHAEVRDAVAVGDPVHGLEFLFGGLEGRFQAGDLAEPAFAAGFGDAGLEVVADLQQPGLLGWVRPKLRASDAPLTELTPIFQQFMAGFRSLTLICPRDRIG
jgi:hypothetical protein